MLYTNNIKKAINLAYKLHLNETDEYGLPLVYSIYGLASKISDEHGVCAALLFNAVEKKKITLDKLKKEYPFEVTDTIFMLITDDSLAYPDYIRRIKSNTIATLIKIVELEMKIKLLDLNPNKNKVKIELEKYEFALNILKK